MKTLLANLRRALPALALLALSATPVLSQQPPSPAPATTAPATAPAAPAAPSADTKTDAPPAEAKTDTKAPDTKADAPAASPVPSGDNLLTGFIELGYRWNTGTGGSFQTYRSIVNLGSGPKLVGTEFTLTAPKHRLFDRVDVRAYDWGGDPYSTLHVTARKEKLYEFNADYRNFALFDNVPSFADPTISRGLVLDQQSFDTHRKISSFTLDFLPGNWIIPYLNYDNDSSTGRGVTTLNSSVNEYPFATNMSDATQIYRAGVRLELKRFHITVEQGGTTFRSAQSSFVAPGSINYGSDPYPSVGQTLDLTALAQAYGIRGSSLFTKGLITAHVTSWLDVTGQFLYSVPKTTTNYQQYDTGNFVSLNQAIFYNGEQALLMSAAKQPHTTGSAGAEMRPLKHVRIVQSWYTDRLHNSGSNNGTDILGSTPRQIATLNLSALLYNNYSQAENNVFVEVHPGVVVRAGYRYVWGDGNELVTPLEGLYTHDRVHLRRNVGIAGVTYRFAQKYSLSADAEVARSGSTYYRTDLTDYQKVRIHGSYQATASINLSANVSILQNDWSIANYNSMLSHQEALSVQWNPKAGKRLTFSGTYEHQSYASDILYLPPQTLMPTESRYWESGHTITGLVSTVLPKIGGIEATFSGGGSFLLSTGSNPTSYYQPVGKLTVPITKRLLWNTEWRYYGFGEAFYLYESFRTHLITTGLRFTR